MAGSQAIRNRPESTWLRGSAPGWAAGAVVWRYEAVSQEGLGGRGALRDPAAGGELGQAEKAGCVGRSLKANMFRGVLGT